MWSSEEISIMIVRHSESFNFLVCENLWTHAKIPVKGTFPFNKLNDFKDTSQVCEIMMLLFEYSGLSSTGFRNLL